MPARLLKWAAIAVAAILLIGAAVVLATVLRHEEGYFSPVISPDGTQVYFVRRTTSGAVWGLGWEFFTPPAHAYLWRDRYQLCRIRLDGGAFETLRAFPPSPLEGRTVREYRGRAFGIANAALRFQNGRLDCQIAVSVPKQPSSETWAVEARWPAGGAAVWTRRYSPFSTGDDVLYEPWEVLVAPGRENFPSAVVAHNDASGELRVLVRNSVFGRLFPDGLRWAVLAPTSRASDIRRMRAVRDLRARLIEEENPKFSTEVAAILAADRRLEDLGYYPKPPQLIARAVAPAGAKGVGPLIRISEEEFRVGLFQDIEKAIASPGAEVEKLSGNYIIHRDYDTSARLNAVLASGATHFYIERSGRTYELTITPGRPPLR